MGAAWGACLSAWLHAAAALSPRLPVQDMARRDAALEARLAKVGADKAAIVTALAGFAGQQAERRSELEKLQAADRAIFAEFEELTGGASGGLAFYGSLLRIYKRRVKRARRKDGAAAGAAEEKGGDSDSDSDDDDDGGAMDDDDEDEDVDDTCPDGCDKSMYERVLGMRSRRLDVEEAVAEVNRAIDELRRSADKQSVRERGVDKELAATDAEIASFQVRIARRSGTVAAPEATPPVPPCLPCSVRSRAA